MTIKVWAFVLIILGCLLAGLVAGFFATRKIFQTQMEKNPDHKFWIFFF